MSNEQKHLTPQEFLQDETYGDFDQESKERCMLEYGAYRAVFQNNKVRSEYKSQKKQQKPLSAEEMLNDHKRRVPSEVFSGDVVFFDNAVNACNEYAAKQVAAAVAHNIAILSEEAEKQTAALREKLAAYESGGHTLIPTTELAALREELAAVNAANKIIIKRNQELEVLERLYTASAKAYNKTFGELVAVKKELLNAKAAQDAYYEIAEILIVPEGGSVIEAAEAVKMERENLSSDLFTCKEMIKGQKDALLEIVSQRDDAVMLLEDWAKQVDHMDFGNMPDHELSGLGLLMKRRDIILSRISSGETKQEFPNSSTNREAQIEKAAKLPTGIGAPYNNRNAYTAGFLNGARWADKNPNGSTWISVKDRLPEEGGRYMVYVTELSDLGVSNYVWNCSWGPLHGFTYDIKPYKVTHWMPLPAPPESLTDK